MEDYDRDFRFWAKHAEELAAQYPDEWVAIFDCKVVAHSPESSEMWRQLEQLGLRWKARLVDFIWGTPITFVF
jgi:hypothetical protein